MRSRPCGGELWVRKVAIKPGKPLVLGKMANAVYIGLPGNPGALFTTFKVIVENSGARAGIDRAVGGGRDRKFRLEGTTGSSTTFPPCSGATLMEFP